MFLLHKEEELTPLILGQIINQFLTQTKPKLDKYYNYYMGKQKITHKVSDDPAKKYNKVVVNYCSNIVDTYNGYLTGIDIQYNSEDDIEAIANVLNYNDVHSEDTELLKNALVFGYGVEINYVDEDSQQRFKCLDPRECIDIYDDTLNQNLLYAVRFYSADYAGLNNEEYYVEVYSDKSIKTYKSTLGFSSFTFVDEKPHYFKQVPLTFFYLNTDKTNIFDRIIALQDAYNELVSGEIDDFDAFADAYLILKGLTADAEDIQSMRENRVLILDNDSDAFYLTKNISETQVQEILSNLNDSIHKVANSPDFNSEKFWASTGVALRYKLVGFENAASVIEANMKKALQKRIELICAIENIKGFELVWRDIHIIFSRNLPANIEETAQVVNSLRGLVSNKTLLAQIPFVTDVDAEMEQVAAEKEENINLYSFASGTNKEEVEDE